MELKSNPMYPKRMNFLLAELQAGRLSQHEFQKECAYWLLEDDCWNDLRPKEICYEKIVLVMKKILQRDLTKEEIDQLDKYNAMDTKNLDVTFLQQVPIANLYEDVKNEFQKYNRARKEQLEEFIKYLLPDDVASKQKYQQKIYEFNRVINDVTKQDLDGLAQDVIKTFGGRVQVGS